MAQSDYFALVFFIAAWGLFNWLTSVERTSSYMSVTRGMAVHRDKHIEHRAVPASLGETEAAPLAPARLHQVRSHQPLENLPGEGAGCIDRGRDVVLRDARARRKTRQVDHRPHCVVRRSAQHDRLRTSPPPAPDTCQRLRPSPVPAEGPGCRDSAQDRGIRTGTVQRACPYGTARKAEGNRPVHRRLQRTVPGTRQVPLCSTSSRRGR